MGKRSQQTLKNQKRMLYGLLGFFLLLTFSIGFFYASRPNGHAPSIKTKPIQLPADQVNPQDLWTAKFEAQNSLFDQKIKYLETVLLDDQKRKEEAEQEKEKLQLEVTELKEEIAILASLPPVITEFGNEGGDPFVSNPVDLDSPRESVPISVMSMPLPSSSVKNVANVIPAGTSVKALLVSSVDAGCGVYSPSNPIPVKLRILDDGHLPKGVDVRLKGGVIIGSAYGDLSSERLFVRMERLTQVKEGGDFVETEVAGYATGEDGKYGVRGTVVDRSEKIVANAALSGLFGQTGDILQAAVGRWRVDTYLSTNQQTGNEPTAPGFGVSTANAFGMLADYYIRRAEQVEPVIQVNAGRIIDLTFTHGADLGDLNTHDKVREVRLNNQGLR